MDWSTFLSAVLGSAVATTLIGTVVGAVLGARFNRSLETYRAKLQADSVRFTRLHDERQRFVLSINAALIESRSRLGQLLSPLQAGDRNWIAQESSARAEAAKLHNLVLDARLVFAPQDYCAVKAVSDGYASVLVKAQTIMTMCNGNEQMLDVGNGRLRTQWHAVRSELKSCEEAEEALVARFRGLMGVG